MRNKIVKFACLFLAAAVFSGSAFPALAQLGDVPVSHPGLGQSGITGSVADTAADLAVKAAETKLYACKTAEEIALKSLMGTEAALTGLSLIGDGAGETVAISAKLTGVNTVIDCRTVADGLLKAVPTPNLFVGQKKQRLEEENSVALQNFKKIREDLQTRASTAKQRLWKGILARVLLTTTKSVSASIVNKLTNKYKVNDVRRYADAVAGQVYTTDLIRKNAADNEEQMVLRTMLNNPLASQQVDPLIAKRADEALGYDPDKINVNDSGAWAAMARSGAADANPFFMQTAATAKAQNMSTQGQQAALSEITLGNGLKSPRTCNGSIAEQAAIDKEYAAANREIADRQKLLRELEDYKAVSLAMPIKPSAEDLQRLDQDIQKASQDLAGSKQKLSSIRNKPNGAVVEICEGIVSPASLVDKGIDKAFNQFAKNLGDYNDNNLPFFVNFISDIATGITTDLIFGGNSGSAIVHESRSIDKAVVSAAGLAGSNIADSLSKGIRFSYAKSGASATSYTLEWEVLDVKNASYVTIKGTGISDATKLPLSGKYEIQTSASSTYLMKVFDSKGKQLQSTSLEIVVSRTGNVAGVSVIKTLGPIHPRGR
jgi:hypothetical protein